MRTMRYIIGEKCIIDTKEQTTSQCDIDKYFKYIYANADKEKENIGRKLYDGKVDDILNEDCAFEVGYDTDLSMFSCSDELLYTYYNNEDADYEDEDNSVSFRPMQTFFGGSIYAEIHGLVNADLSKHISDIQFCCIWAESGCIMFPETSSISIGELRLSGDIAYYNFGISGKIKRINTLSSNIDTRLLGDVLHATDYVCSVKDCTVKVPSKDTKLYLGSNIGAFDFNMTFSGYADTVILDLGGCKRSDTDRITVSLGSKTNEYCTVHIIIRNVPSDITDMPFGLRTDYSNGKFALEVQIEQHNGTREEFFNQYFRNGANK